jgi:hypothetical protein
MKKILLIVALMGSLFGGNILEKVDKALSPFSSESYKKLINIEPDGSKKEFLLYQAKKDNDKMVSLFLRPESEKGRVTLRLGENMWLYIPEVGRALRLTSMQSVTGGVFNNADIMRIDFAVEYDVISEKVNGDEIIVETKAKTETVAYDKLIMSIDKKTMTPKKIECFSSTEMLIKTIIYKDMKDFGNGIVRPATMETFSPLYKGYKSLMIYGKITPKKFNDEAFTLESLSKAEDLRR